MISVTDTNDLNPVERAALAPAARRPSRGPAKKKDNNAVIQKQFQKFLRAQDPKVEQPQSRLQSIFHSLFRMATDARSGQSKASAELILAYGYDKPKPAPDELEAMKKSGLQVVFVERGGLEGVPKRELPAPESTPEFLDAEFKESDQ